MDDDQNDISKIPPFWQAAFEALAETSEAGVFLCAPGGHIVAANGHMCDLFGQSGDVIRERSFADLFPGAGLDNLAAGTPVFKDRLPLSAQNGVTRQVDVEVRRLPGGYVLGQARLVARAQDAISRFEFFDHAPVAIFRIDDDGTILDANERACRSLGYTYDELTSLKVFDIDPTFPPERWIAHRRSLAKIGFRQTETLHRRKDGSTFPVEVSINYYRSGGKPYSFSFARDISELKLSEDNLQKLNRVIREALRLARMGHWEYDLTTQTFTFNDQYYSLHGTTAAEAGGYRLAAADFFNHYIFPADLPLIFDAIQQGIDTTDPDFTCQREARILHADGTPVDVIFWFRIEKDAQNRTTHFYGVSQDISERKRAELALQESEDLLRRSQSVGQIGSYYFDAHSNQWISTPALDELFGIDDRYVKDTAGWLALIHPDERDSMLAYFSQYVLTERHAFDREYRIVRQNDQQERWVHGRGRLEFDEDGQTSKMIGTIQDITARKQAELALRASETRFRTLTEQLPDFVWQKDLNSVYFSCNKHYADTVGLSVEQIVGHTDADFYPPDLAEQYLTADQQVITNGQPLVFEERWLYKGVERWLLTTKVPLLDDQGKCIGTIGIGRDITERRHFEQSLRESEERFSRAFHASPAGLAITEIETGNLIDVNEQYCNILGYRKEEIQGISAKDLGIFEDWSLRQKLVDQIRLEGSCKEVLVRMITKSGEVREVNWSGEIILLGGRPALLSMAFDVTERRRAEEAAASSAEQMRAMFETISDGIAFTDMLGNLTQVNDAVLRIHEYPNREELLGKSSLDLIAPADRPRALENMMHVLQTGHSGLIEYKFITRNGREFYAELSSSMLTDREGKPTGFVALTRDISERKRMENALHTANESLNRAQRIAHLGSWEVHLPTGKLTLSETMRQIFGLSEGQPDKIEDFANIFAPSDLTHFRAAFQTAIDDNAPYSVDYQITRPDGQSRFVHDEGQVIRDESGQAIWMIGTTLDVTEIKRSEILLKTMNAAAIAMQRANSPDQVLQKVIAELEKIGLCCSFLSIDAKKETLLSEIVSLPNIKQVEEIIGPDHVSAPIPITRVEAFRQAVEEQKAVYIENLEEITSQVLHHTNKELSARVSELLGVSKSVIAPLIINDEVTGLFTVQSNELRETDIPSITAFAHQIAAAWRRAQLLEQAQQELAARREAEAQVRQLNEELESRVKDRTAELQAANAELEAFAYSVSHDLRAPLRAINGYTQILIEDYGTKLDNDGMRVCDVIGNEAKRMGQLIDDLLTFSRLGRAQMQVFEVDMYAMVSAIYNEMVPEQDRQRIQFDLLPLDGAMADPVLLRQVWVNLLSNAVKFTHKCARANIQVGSRVAEGAVTFWVKDNGAGFDMRYAGKLFGVFQRLHSEKDYEGTGVGLAIVHRVITRHGGRVWAESQVNEGATFYFSLPLKGSNSHD